MVPGRAGADTQTVVHIPLSQLRDLPGAPGIEEAFIRARLGEPGYLAGKDAEVAACDSMTERNAMAEEITYFALVDDYSSRDKPGGAEALSWLRASRTDSSPSRREKPSLIHR